MEGPGLAVWGYLPATGEVRRPLQLRVVLDKHRIDVLEGHVRVGLEGDKRVHRVDGRATAQPEHAAVLDAAAGRGRTATSHGEGDGGRRCDYSGSAPQSARSLCWHSRTEFHAASPSFSGDGGT